VNIAVREWQHQARQPLGVLDSDSIHIWQWRHEAAFAQNDDTYGPLSPDERARAARFLAERPRREYVATRSTLRQILGQYLNAPPERLGFRYSERGKPSLVDDPKISFNVSHSGDLSVLAVTCGRDIGVDVEWVRADVEAAALAARFFSRHERERLLRLHGGEITQAFFRCWTRKEAYIKARGDGLSLALDSFDVSLDPGAASALLHTRPDPEEARKWVVRDLGLPVGFAAAVAWSAAPSS